MRRISTLLLTLAILALPVTDHAFARSIPAGVTRTSRRTLRKEIRAQDQLRLKARTADTVTLGSTYTNTDLGVEIKYPDGWDKQELLQQEGALTLAVMFLSPVGPAIRQNINLVVETLPDGMTLDQYTELALDNEQALLPDFTLVSSASDTVAGQVARRVVFTANAGAGPMTFEQVWYLRDGTAHVWTFADDSKDFAPDAGTFDRMLNSLVLH